MQANEAVGATQTCAQLLERDARRVGSEDRVRTHLLFRRRVDALLEIEPLRSRLDHEVGRSNSIAAQIGHQPIERVADIGAFVADLLVKVGRALDRAGNRLRLHVAEAHRQPMPCAPGGDVAAHGAGADDMDAGAGPFAVGKGLHAFTQEKHAHQVLRCRGDDQARERGDFGFLHRRRIAAVRLPQIDQCIGRRVVLRGRLGLCFLAHARGQQRPRRAAVEQRYRPARPRGLQLAGGDVANRRIHVTFLRHRIHEAQRFCAPSPQGAPGQHHRHRFDRIDEARQPHGAAEPGVQAEQHLGEAEARVLGRDPIVAGERDFEPSAQTVAVNDGDRRHVEAIEPVDNVVGELAALPRCHSGPRCRETPRRRRRR